MPDLYRKYWVCSLMSETLTIILCHMFKIYHVKGVKMAVDIVSDPLTTRATPPLRRTTKPSFLGIVTQANYTLTSCLGDQAHKLLSLDFFRLIVEYTNYHDLSAAISVYLLNQSLTYTNFNAAQNRHLLV